ncbi:hypothetical protein CRYPD_990 [uncultured Candidatus Thioglobus sp.]|nr:hypothetical protein CRYPD_990 [uncultured Candidatus Thioglobus sp.]
MLLEGKSDCNIVKKFCEDNKINTQFGFCNCENDNQVLSQLNALLQGSNQPEIIGIILDADNDINARYQEIINKTTKFYKKLPSSILKTGLVHTENGLPKLGVWIMPNNQDNGALEKFYLELATDIDTAFINDVIKRAENKKLTSFKSQHRNKAIMHTYFAWQDSPSDPLHSAINKIALDNSQEIATTFKIWLVQLFN